MFQLCLGILRNLIGVERSTYSLQNDRSVTIKPADKGSAVVVWYIQDYLKEAERQLSDSSNYKEVIVTEKDLVDLVIKATKYLLT